jgi:FG-GAP-like repeat
MRVVTLALILSSLVAASQGQFIPQKVFTLPGGTVSRFLAKGDFNGDGKLDVLLAGRNASAKPVLVVFLGNGTGGFGVPIVTTIAGVNKAQIALAGDLNGDGIQDAVVTGTDTVTGVTEFGVMLADGTGKFKTPVFTRASVAALMTLGDYTGDGKIDLVLLTP